MHVAVIGLGNFGSALTQRLFELGHQVTALDINPKALAPVQDMAHQAVAADATDRAVLEELGVDLADAAVVSLGGDMAASILVTLHLKEMRVKKIIAKAISSEHKKILSRVGAGEVIFPERDAAKRLAGTMTDPNLLEYLPIGHEFSVAEVAPPPEFLGKTLVELDLRRRFGVNVIAVRQLVPEQTTILIQPDYRVKDSDILVVVGRHENIQRLHQRP